MRISTGKFACQATVLVVLLLLAADCSKKSTGSDEPEPYDEDVVRVPAEYVTIQAAIDAIDSSGTVVVSNGTYAGYGNCNLSISGKQVILKSVNGPEFTIIDCQGSAEIPSYGIRIESGSGSSVVEGFTIRNGYFTHGAAAYCLSASPVFRNCLFAGNHATVSGGAVRCKGSSAWFYNCTFADNSSPAGGGLFLLGGSSPTLENCIIALSTEGGAIYSSGPPDIPTLRCCDIFGNVGGDWEGIIADQADSNGNFSADPLFCDAELGDYRIGSESPCAADNSTCGTLIGIDAFYCDQPRNETDPLTGFNDQQVR
jgi:predicted outer membrane repeat protein